MHNGDVNQLCGMREHMNHCLKTSAKMQDWSMLHGQHAAMCFALSIIIQLTSISTGDVSSSSPSPRSCSAQHHLKIHCPMRWLVHSSLFPRPIATHQHVLSIMCMLHQVASCGWLHSWRWTAVRLQPRPQCGRWFEAAAPMPKPSRHRFETCALPGRRGDRPLHLAILPVKWSTKRYFKSNYPICR